MGIRMVKGYFYIFGSGGNTSKGEITGAPGKCGGTVFMGFCKPKTRSKAKEGDWIIGISNAKIKPRRILSMIEVESKPKLHEAIDKYPEAIWSEENPRGQIYVEKKEDENGFHYDYIENAPHDESDRENDMERYPDTNTLIVGSSNSVILGKNGYLIDERILDIIRKDPDYENEEIDRSAPFGRDKNGRCKGRNQVAEVELDKKDLEYLKSTANKTDEKRVKQRGPKK